MRGEGGGGGCREQVRQVARRPHLRLGVKHSPVSSSIAASPPPLRFRLCKLDGEGEVKVRCRDDEVRAR